MSVKGSSGDANGHMFCKQKALTTETGRRSQRQCPQPCLAHDPHRDLHKGTEDRYNPWPRC